MKNFLYFVAIITLFGCQDEIQTSNPTLQGLRHGDEIWRATTRTATLQTTGILNLSGSDGFGTVIISLPSATVGEYPLGEGQLATITYTELNTTYSTQNNGNEYPVYLGDGKVTIDAINAENKTLRGTFYFNSYDSTGTKYMNFSEGVFYNLQFTTGE